MCKSINEKYILLLSHLTRGAWIEIYPCHEAEKLTPRRTSHEVRGLKLLFWVLRQGSYRRTSHEVRGLKSLKHHRPFLFPASHLTRGAWIEILS